MASPVSPLTTNNTTSSSTTAAAASASSDQEVFLQLLVSQLQNQDPMNPTDSTQFVSELAQFSELEQTIAIRNDIESQAAASTTTPATGTSQTPNAAIASAKENLTHHVSRI